MRPERSQPSAEHSLLLQARERLNTVLWLLPFVVVFVRTSWLSDDAFITYRTLDHLLQGYGLRYNIGERVQAFTHPLWALVLTPWAFLFRDFFLVGHLVSIVTATLALYLLRRTFRLTLEQWVLLLALFLTSDAFLSYSTSGLENPLSHLLVVAFAGVAVRPWTARHVRAATLIASLLLLNRLDYAFLIGPGLLFLVVRELRTSPVSVVLRDLVVGSLPLLAWHGFAFLYYGSPLPNTAYAKLLNSWTPDDTVREGYHYFLWTWRHDPVTLYVFGLAALAVLSCRSWPSLSLLAGVAAYAAYVLGVGGDFMGGRFFSTPFVVCLAVVAHSLERLPGRVLVRVAVAILMAGVVFAAGEQASLATALTGSAFGKQGEWERRCTMGVADERACYYQATGLMSQTRTRSGVMHWWRTLGEGWAKNGITVATFPNTGFSGFYAGPSVHLVDNLALSDPLLARLRPARFLAKVGHHPRLLPYGYRETLQSGQNHIHDPKIHAAYDRLLPILRAPLFSRDRLAALFSGAGLRTIEITTPEIVLRIPESAFTSDRDTSAPWWDPKNILLTRGGLRVELGRTVHASHFTLRMDHSDFYEASFWRKEQRLGGYEFQMTTNELKPHTAAVPPAIARQGYDAVQITPLRGDEIYTLRYFRLIDDPV